MLIKQLSMKGSRRPSYLGGLDAWSGGVGTSIGGVGMLGDWGVTSECGQFRQKGPNPEVLKSSLPPPQHNDTI